MPAPGNALTRSVIVGALSPSGEHVKLAAAGEELRILEAQLGVSRVYEAGLAGKLRRWKKTGARLEGKLEALIEQPCVASGNPVKQEISLEVCRVFVTAEAAHSTERFSDEGELVLDPEAEEPDILSNGKFDLWDVLIEELNLAVERFPRVPDAVFEPENTEESGSVGENDALARPFFGLEALIREKDSKNHK